MTSTEQTNGSSGSTGERAAKRRRNIILGAVAVGVLVLALLAVGVLPRKSGTGGTVRTKPPVTISTTTTTTTVPSTTTTISTGGGSPVVTTTTSTP